MSLWPPETIAAPRSPELSTLQGTISSKQYGCEDLITRLVAKACIDVCPKNSNNFNVDNVRVCKVRLPRDAACNTANAGCTGRRSRAVGCRQAAWCRGWS